MEKGDQAFTKFEEGYQYFHSLDVKHKIKLVLDLCQSLITL